MGDRPGNEATLGAFRAHKQRWRTASFLLMIGVFLVCECVRDGTCTYSASLFLSCLGALLCPFLNLMGEMDSKVNIC